MLRHLTRFSAWSLYALILGLYAFSLWALFDHRHDETFWSWQEIGQILRYSTQQAGISAALSTLFGVLLARSFFYLQFVGKTLLYKVISFAWALPSLVVIFAVIGVWGKAGWLAQSVAVWGGKWDFPLYGLVGIVLAHLLFNLPLATKYTLEGLNLVPSSQHQLAAQLNLRGWAFFRVVEWPVLKGILPYAFSHIFLICFTSFPIVLMLGGGPKYSTLEVAIYQAVTFEFDFAKAVMLIACQLGIGLLLQLAMDFSTRRAFSLLNHTAAVDFIWRATPKGGQKVGLVAVLSCLSALVIVPLCHVVWAGLRVPNGWEKLTHPALWHAFGFSFLISLVAAITVIAIAYVIALEARQLAYRQHHIAQSLLAGVSTYPLILPVFMLAVGLFLLLIEVELAPWQLVLLVGFCNGLMLLPYIYRLIFSAMWQAWSSHHKLAESLGLHGFRRWWIVEKPYLIRPLRNAFALAMASGLGSFSVIAFFGSPDFRTLPYLLYQQIGSYRMDDAAVTALVLMLFTFLPFLAIEQKENKK